MLKFENGKNFQSLEVTISRDGKGLLLSDLLPQDSDKSFDYSMVIDGKEYKGVGNFGDDAIWLPYDNQGIKIIKDNPKYHSLDETCKNMEEIGLLELPVLPKLFWCEVSQNDSSKFLIACYEKVSPTSTARTSERDAYLPPADKAYVESALQADTTTNTLCVELFYKHSIVPEDEWYKRKNLIGGKVVDCHRFRIAPDRYKFKSNGKDPDEMNNIYRTMVNRYLSIRDNMGLPKWKGKIYQGFEFDNGVIFHGYTSSGRIYDSYEKLPFMPYNKVKGKKVLDLGSNQGFFSFQAAMAGAESVTGVEITQPDLDAANDIKKILGLDNVEFLNKDAVAFLEETNEEYELIIANSVIHQIYNNLVGAEKMLENIAKKGKYFVFETPANHTTMSIPLESIAQKLEEHFSVVRLLHVYDAYSSGYRANFVCYS